MKEKMSEDDVTTLFICLEDENEFPSWFKGSKTYLSILLNRQIGNSSRYAYDNEYFGEDKNYKFYMNEIRTAKSHSNTYAIFISFTCKPKNNNIMGRNITFSYVTLPPLYV
jgi:hypothetical protein